MRENLSGLKDWDVSKVSSFNYMFDGAINLNSTSPINNWNISPSANFSKMFKSAPTYPNFAKVFGTWNADGTFFPST